uniref:Uncharacterized protein n=1 Tax=Oryza brachyantha TaxID=4533 RepID=J3L4X7_ORYBR
MLFFAIVATARVPRRDAMWVTRRGSVPWATKPSDRTGGALAGVGWEAGRRVKNE